MLSKSKASPCILTLILSFVLSDYYINLKRIKLKACIIYAQFTGSPKISNFKEK